MKRLLLGAIAATGVAHGDPKPAEGKPDPLAEDQAREANLESNAPREGVTLSAAIGGSLFIGQGAVGKGGAISLRLGHVATPNIVLTFEVTGGSFFHKIAMMGPAARDDDGNVLAGAQYYTSPSLWIRGSAGFGVYTRNDGPLGTTTLPGPAGAVGVGVDLVRRHYLVLGLEAFGVGQIHRGGFLAMSGLCLGLSYY